MPTGRLVCSLVTPVECDIKMQSRRNICELRAVRTLVVLTIAFIGVAFTQPAAAQQGGIELLAPEMLFARGIRVSLTGISRVDNQAFSGSDDVTDPLSRRFEETTTVLGLDYGIRADLSVSLLVPHSSKELRSGGTTQSADGLGDIAFLTKYRVWKTDWFRSAAQMVVYGGIEMPTGESRETENGVRLSHRVQPGRGAWNPMVGLAANLELDRWRFDLSTLYKFNQNGTGRRRGDSFFVEVDGAYRFWHEPYPGPSASIKVGLRYSYAEHARLTGTTIDNSGFDLVTVHPGMTFHFTPATTVKFSYDIPIYRDYNGTQLAFERRFAVAFGMRF